MTTDNSEIRVAEMPSGLDDYRVENAYAAWQQREGVKVIVDFAFDDLATVELTPWERKGGNGAIINIPNRTLPNDAHLVEIKPGGKSEPEHHMYEETVYIVAGRGATSIWTDEKEKSTFEWHTGSLFAIPLNAWYQHFNASGTEPARYIAVTNAPPMMRLFRDEEFIFKNPHTFKGRFSGEEDYFSGNGKLYNRRVWESNFVPNAPDMMLYRWKERGAGGINVMLQLAKSSMGSHISEFPVGTYKKAHRHGPGAHLLILSGQGYSQLWHEGNEYRKSDWKTGGMVIVPEDAMFHQHYNTGPTRARYLALRPGGMAGGGGNWGGAGGGGGIDVSVNEGGAQIEYEDEAKLIHEIFEAECERNGAPCRMKAFIPWCTGEVGPTSERDT
jgi:quercetin dioxygenase-like cupin family protein